MEDDFPSEYWVLLKEHRNLEFYEKAINFVIHRDHMWCKYQGVMNELIVVFTKIEYEAIQYLHHKMHIQLRGCEQWYVY